MATFTEDFTRLRQDFDQPRRTGDQLFQDTREHVRTWRRASRSSWPDSARTCATYTARLPRWPASAHRPEGTAHGPAQRRRHFPQGSESHEEPLSSRR